MRTIKEIKKEITAEFMASKKICEAYNLREGEVFEEHFSVVSIESILFGIVASAIYVLEGLFAAFKKDIDTSIATSVVASIPWYYRKALEFQYGEELEYNDTTYSYEYSTDKPRARVVKYAAAREESGYVYLLVSGEDGEGYPVRLSNDVLTAFKEYMRFSKPAGVPIEIASYNPDEITINLGIEYNPLVLNSDGSKITEPSVFPVEDAIKNYLRGIEYGGVFNSTKMVDALQQVPGVKDVLVGVVSVKASGSEKTVFLSGNSCTSVGGSFKLVNTKDNIRYATQL